MESGFHINTVPQYRWDQSEVAYIWIYLTGLGRQNSAKECGE